MKTNKLLVIIGTRPEAVKMAPLVQALQARSWAQVRVLASAQHRQMLDQILDLFQIRVDVDLDLMRPDQTLADLSARMISAIDEVLASERPDCVLVQGDTTTAMTAALTCHYHRIPLGHVEAGLRTHDKYSPFPEEMNRRLIGSLADLHFAPTEGAAENLRREGLDPETIFMTGNTVVDAMQWAVEQVQWDAFAALEEYKLIVVTMHRRESLGQPLEELCRALLALADRGDTYILFPVHPNPAVHGPVHAWLGKHPNIQLMEPMGYREFVTAMACSHLILTDSGGVQEEAPSLGKPVLVLREETERPEAIQAGCSILVGTSSDRILKVATNLLDDEQAYDSMARVENPFGDGRASQRICDILQSRLER